MLCVPFQSYGKLSINLPVLIGNGARRLVLDAGDGSLAVCMYNSCYLSFFATCLMTKAGSRNVPWPRVVLECELEISFIVITSPGFETL